MNLLKKVIHKFCFKLPYIPENIFLYIFPGTWDYVFLKTRFWDDCFQIQKFKELIMQIKNYLITNPAVPYYKI